MSGSQHTSIEELVMSSARGFLYGHPLAWDVPGRGRPSAEARRATRRGRLTALVNARRGTTASHAPAMVEARGCG